MLPVLELRVHLQTYHLLEQQRGLTQIILQQVKALVHFQKIH
jgi:hypothetical protein